MRVLIVGAGLAGLCLAQGLVGAGVEVVVHERDPGPDSRPQGYRIHLDGRADEGLRVCLPPDLYRLFRATTGRPSRRFSVVIKQLKPLHTIRFPEPQRDRAAAEPGSEPGPGPGPLSTSVDRLVLRTVLLCGLGKVVRFGSEFVSFEQEGADGPVRARFADGSEDVGDLLVAADGVGSRVRGQYLPQARVPDSGGRTLYGRTPLTDEVRGFLPETLGGGFTAVVGSRRLGMALGLVDFREPLAETAARLRPDADFGTIGSYAMWALSGQGRAFPPDRQLRELDPAGLHRVATDLVRGWHPALRSLIERATESETGILGIRVSEPVEPWPSSSVTLLGDAIHAMSPARGSGANIALKDAGRLCAQLTAAAQGGTPLLDAVARYEADMRDYGFAAVQDSLAVFRQGGGPLAGLAALLSRRSKR